MGKTLDRYKRYAQIVGAGAKHDFGWVFDRVGLGKYLGDAQAREASPDSGALTLAERSRLFVLHRLGAGKAASS